MKICTNCKQEKPLTEYYKNKTYGAKGIVYYPHSNCKTCHKKRTLNHSSKPEIKMKRRLRPPLSQRPTKKIKTWTDIKSRIVKRQKFLRNTDEHHNQRNILYRSLNHAIHGKITNKTSIERFGCTWKKLRTWLQEQFKVNMTWDNHGCGPGKWNIDHMECISKFDLSIQDQRIKCFHYTNLQPMWHYNNSTKRNKNVYNMKWTGLKWLIRGTNGLYRPRRLFIN